MKASSIVLSISQYLIKLSIFLLFASLSSVVIPELWNGTQTGKSFVFFYSIIVILFLHVPKLIFSNSFTCNIKLLECLFGILLIYITVNRYFIQNVYGLSLSYYELLGLAIVYVIIRNSGPPFYLYLFIAVIISGIIQAVYGNLQLIGFYPSYHSSFKLTGSFFNPGPYASYLSCVFPMALGLYLYRREVKEEILSPEYSIAKSEKIFKLIKWILRYIPIVGVVTILMVLPATRSRAAWLGVMISSLFLLANKLRVGTAIKKYLNTQFKRTLSFILAATNIFGVITSFYFFKKDSSNGRLLVWKVTENMIRNNPWTGVGFDRFKANYMLYQADYFKTNIIENDAVLADNVYYAFNEFLQFFSENGILGMLLLMIVLISTFKKEIDTSYLSIVAKAGLLSVMGFSLFSYPSQILPIKLVVVLLLVVLISRKKNELKSFLNKFSYSTVSYSGRSVVALVFLYTIFLSCTHFNNLYKSIVGWQTAYSAYQSGGYSYCIGEYEKSYSVLNQDGDYLMNYGKALSIERKHKKAIEVLNRARQHLNTSIIQIAMGDSYKALKEYGKSEDAYLTASRMTPDRFYPKYLLVKLYNESNQQMKAIKLAKEILAKKVKIESMAIHEIKAAMDEMIKKSSYK